MINGRFAQSEVASPDIFLVRVSCTSIMGLVGLKQAPRDIKQAPLLAFVLMSGQKKKKRKHTYELGQSEVPFYPAKRHS